MDNKVLIIDSNTNFLYGLENKFAVSGIEVIKYDGMGLVEDVIQFLRDDKINFIVSDLEFPNFNGFDVLEKIKSEPDFSQIPFFVYTYIKDEEIRIKTLNLGASYYFLKEEIGLDEFLIKIKNILLNQEKMRRLYI